MTFESCFGTRARVRCQIGFALLVLAFSIRADQLDIPAPPDRGTFAWRVVILPDGNFLVADPEAGPSFNGAVHLYSPTGTLLDSVRGAPGDQIGSGGVTLLPNGDYVIRSPELDDGARANVGAVTWVDGNLGLPDAISAANSLVGASADDRVGLEDIVVLTNGHFVVGTPRWDNSGVVDAGAVTWVSGSAGAAGPVSATNSLVGTTAGDQVGHLVVALGNGNYVVGSPGWNHDGAARVGAVTWSSGNPGLVGVVGPANSLIGTAPEDSVGLGITALANGNYVATTPAWDNGTLLNVGAATWAPGDAALVGVVSPSNSLIGGIAYDQVGQGVVPLANGNFVVVSDLWQNGPAAFAAGAATWGNGSTGLAGVVSGTNSLIGTQLFDQVGFVTPLVNGNYVVCSPAWNDGPLEQVGAVTWADGSTGRSGAISSANSLVGTRAFDWVGDSCVALANGHGVAVSPRWNNDVASDVGAATWIDGNDGLVGAVSASNSLVGTSAGDNVGWNGAVALSNGHYAVSSSPWDNGSVKNVGAVTWGNGVTGTIGAVSAANSLIGTRTNDLVGRGRIDALGNGRYVVGSPLWDDDARADVGAVTLLDGSGPSTRVVTAGNSLVGTTAGDEVGNGSGVAIAGSHYVIRSPLWDSPTATQAGAITLARADTGAVGPVLAYNSVMGSTPSGGYSMVFAADPARDRLVVGQIEAGLISILTLPVEPVFGDGFE